MFIKDDITLTGKLTVQLFGPDGQIKTERHVDNLVVTTGKNFAAARMVGAVAAMSHMAIGSGTVAAVVADTALGLELGRAVLTSSTNALAVSTFVASFAAGVGTGAVTEAGIFNAATAGTMLNRAIFPVVNKDAGDTMSITWSVTAG